MQIKVTKEIIENAYELYLRGCSYAEISRQIGVSANTISKHLRNTYNIKKKNYSKKIVQETFEKLWKEGKTDKEIANYFGVSKVTIKTYRTKGKNAGKFNVIRYFSQTEQTLSDEQEQFILGSLLGDLSLTKPFTNRSKNSRLALVQCEKQKELFMKKVEILGEFMGTYRLTNKSIDKRTGKSYPQYRGNSKAHKVFTNIRNILYINNVKTVTQEYLNKIHSPIALAYWFMDDGSREGAIATNSFSLSECELLISWMNDKWNVICTLQKNKTNYVLHISQKSRKHFEELIFPFMIPSMYYKLKYIQDFL